jgi:predicted GNAT family N-acyltransferase
MFPLSNYLRDGFGSDQPYGTTFWFHRNTSGISDVMARSNNGSLFPQVQTLAWSDAIAPFQGVEITGILGESDQVDALRLAFGFDGIANLDAAEPHFKLALADLETPELDNAHLVPLEAVDHDLMVRWRADYAIEALNSSAKDAQRMAEGDMVNYVANDSHRVLVHNGEPVCTTGFNASLPECVQIGGVYTPPDLRGNGYARTAVAWHLNEAKNNGVTNPILFAASEAAAKAYIAIGFRQIGQFSLVLYDKPQVYHA